MRIYRITSNIVMKMKRVVLYLVLSLLFFGGEASIIPLSTNASSQVKPWQLKEKKINRMLENAVEQFHQKQFSPAKQTCKDIIQINPECWEAYLLLAWIDCNPEVKNYCSARENFEKYFNFNMNKELFSIGGEKIHYELARYNLLRSEFCCFEKKQSRYYDMKYLVKKWTPDLPLLLNGKYHNSTLYIMANACLYAEEYIKAEDYANQYYQAVDNKDLGLILLGKVAKNQGRKTKAISYLNEALKVNSKSTDALWALANIYWPANDIPPYNKTGNSNYNKAVQLRKKAATYGDTRSINWCKKNNIDW